MENPKGNRRTIATSSTSKPANKTSLKKSISSFFFGHPKVVTELPATTIKPTVKSKKNYASRDNVEEIKSVIVTPKSRLQLLRANSSISLCSVKSTGSSPTGSQQGGHPGLLTKSSSQRSVSSHQSLKLIESNDEHDRKQNAVVAISLKLGMWEKSSNISTDDSDHSSVPELRSLPQNKRNLQRDNSTNSNCSNISQLSANSNITILSQSTNKSYISVKASKNNTNMNFDPAAAALASRQRYLAHASNSLSRHVATDPEYQQADPKDPVSVSEHRHAGPEDQDADSEDQHADQRDQDADPEDQHADRGDQDADPEDQGMYLEAEETDSGKVEFESTFVSLDSSVLTFYESPLRQAMDSTTAAVPASVAAVPASVAAVPASVAAVPAVTAISQPPSPSSVTTSVSPPQITPVAERGCSPVDRQIPRTVKFTPSTKTMDELLTGREIGHEVHNTAEANECQQGVQVDLLPLEGVKLVQEEEVGVIVGETVAITDLLSSATAAMNVPTDTHPPSSAVAAAMATVLTASVATKSPTVQHASLTDPKLTLTELTRLNARKELGGLVATELEVYLSDAEFQRVFRMSRQAFAALPLHKQHRKKRSVCLL